MIQTRRALAATLIALPLTAQAAMAQSHSPPRRANPAAEFCVQRLRATFEVETTPAGERGICVLRDGRRMDAWTLFRAYHREVPEQQGQAAQPGQPPEQLPPGGPHLME